MANGNFREILQQDVETFKRPPALPEGHYIGLIKTYEFGQSTKKKTDFVMFILGIKEAGDDVDQEEVADINLADKELRTTFYITPTAMWRLKDFLKAVHGLEDAAGNNAEQMIEDTKGAEVIIEVRKLQSDNDPTVFYNEVGTVVKA